MNSLNPAGSGPPGFFHGQYGGPRVQQSSSENLRNYNFLKSRNENLDPNNRNQSVPFPEPLNDELLEGTANLFDDVGKRIQVILRDGKIIVGELATVDHFSNIVLRDAVERIVVGKYFGDIIRGIFIIRGENIVLVGEVDSEREGEMERVLRQIPRDEILIMQRAEKETEKAKEIRNAEGLKQRGVCFPRQLEDEY